MTTKRIFYSAFFVWLSAAVPIAAQSFPFQITVTQGSTTSIVPNAGVVNMTSPGPGQAGGVSLTLTYLGGSSATFDAAPQVFGSMAFTVSASQTFPLTLRPNDKLSLNVGYVVFSPVGAAPASAQFNMPYRESGGSGTVSLFLFGTTPDVTVSYVLQSTGNLGTLISGGVLIFPETVVNTASDATVSLLNRGSGPSILSALAVTGDAFQILGLPLVPVSIPAGSSLQIVIRYLPRQAGPATGTLQMTLGGNPFTAGLQGTAVVSTLSYELLRKSGPEAITPGQTISLTDTKVGEKTSLDIKIRNSGTASGIVNLPALSGDGFAITDSPRFPVALNPNDSLTMTLTFAPIQPGKATGRLRVNNDTFDLAVTGLGPQLSLSYVAGSSTVTVSPGSAVVFNQTSAGATTKLTLTVQNTGTATATIVSIGIANTAGAFQVADLPPLPVTLDPNSTFTFSALFTPSTTGLSTGTLLIDTAIFLLSGVGTNPPLLPSYKFSGAQGVQDAFQQLPIGLSLTSPYGIPVKGVLTITQDPGALIADPSAQFATGGQTVAFSIPANTTDAVFSNGSKQIKFQTGTVATSITFTPTFATQGGVDLTPASPLTQQVTVQRSAPRLLAAAVTSATSNGFTFTLSGLTTSRSLKSLDFQFNFTSDVNVSSGKVSVDVSNASLIWFQGTTSLAFGGQFDLAVPFTLRVSSGSLQSPFDKLVSVSVTATNDVGTSASVTANLQ